MNIRLLLPVILLINSCYTSTTPKSENQLQELIDRASNGDANAQFNLGQRYVYGIGVSQNYAEAVK